MIISSSAWVMTGAYAHGVFIWRPVKAIGHLPAPTNVRRAMPRSGHGHALADLFLPYFDNAACEFGLVAAFDVRACLIAFTCRAGTPDRVPDMVSAMRTILAEPRCVAIVMAHNHVIGDCRPSAADIDATQRIGRACGLLGLCLDDHLIFAANSVFSFAEAGML